MLQKWSSQGGLEAKQFLENIIAGKWLELSLLLKYDTGQIFDRHKRLVCLPYLPADQDKAGTTSPFGFLSAFLSPFSSAVTMRNVELEMVLNGWAWVVEKYEPDEKYMEALADAQKHKRGIWANSRNVAPWHFKRQQVQRGRAKSSGINQSELFSPVSNDEKCPSAGCGGHLVMRTGKFGEFWGCSKFPSADTRGRQSRPEMRMPKKAVTGGTVRRREEGLAYPQSREGSR